ncbi:MAG: phosphatase PAP2 family protein [Lentisphaerales bacterium]|nr:phosphatase PAP2 family protein [Lentisphaerales bacterium]
MSKSQVVAKEEYTKALVTFVVAFGIFYFTGLDLFISDQAYEITSFESCSTLSTLALLGKASGLVFAIYLLKNFCVSSDKKPYAKKEALFLIIVLLVGPGIVNNFILKPAFNRPRPNEINRYNSQSQKNFTKVLVPAPGKNEKSFPSGHAGSGFFFLALWFIRRIRKKYAWKVFLPAFLWGGAVSTFRVLEGQHFFSDCLGSLCVVYFVSLFLSNYFGLYKE